MKMYNNKLVAAIIVNGKILREFKDTVYLPYGTEYQIRIKNLNTVRVVTDVFIDGTNVVPGGLILNAGQEIDLERSIVNGNLTTGNKFLFVNRSEAIENHRGIKLEDGLIKLEFKFEQPQTNAISSGTQNSQWPYDYRPYPYDKWITYGSAVLPNVGSCAQLQNSHQQAVNMSTNISASSGCLRSASMQSTHQQTENGITVAGSKSEQKFTTGSWFPTESTKHTMILKLLGETPENKSVREPVTVKHQQECNSCGRKNKHNAKFCTECGTGLVLFA